MSSQKKQKGSFFSDPRLLSRVRQYVKANTPRKSIVASVMAEDLQSQYGEYARKKKNAFSKAVDKAYKVVLKERGEDEVSQLEDQHLRKKQKTASKRSSEVDGDSSDSEGSFSSSPENYVQYEDANGMNSMMTNVYQRSPKPTPSQDGGIRKPSSSWYDRSSQAGQKDPESKLSFCDKTLSDSPFSCSSRAGDESTTNKSGLMEDMNTSCDVFFVDRVGTMGDKSLPSRSKVTNTDVIYIEDDAMGVAKDTPKGNKERKDKSVKKTVKKRRKKEDDGEDEISAMKNKGPEVQVSSVTFADFGGNEDCLMEVCKLLVHMKHPEVYQRLGVTPPRGFLLHGPPGCGKTLLANAIAGELGLPYIKLAATELVSGVSGESEERIRDLFDKAVISAPCIVFIDEIDAITPKRETASKDMERRIVAQLLTCMDDLTSKSSAHVLVIGATNRPDSIDPALRRAGRFDREICLGIPDEKARQRILLVLCRELKLVENFDFGYLAKNTPGYVGADLMSLAREAAMTAVNRVFHELQSSNKLPTPSCDVAREGEIDVSMDTGSTDSATNIITKTDTQKDTNTQLQTVLSWLKEHPPLSPEQLENLCITMEDFEEALKHVQPSAKREGFATIPGVTWDDIGALHTVREDLQLAILAPVRHSEAFHELGLNRAQGILLAGPPGCGKTLLAKAVANESGINFISVKGPELLNMYVGESERAVRQVFQRARNSSPCVIFFDELDALCPRRTDSGEGGSSVRVVNQLLTEMDGLEERKQVFIMGATNRPDIIDPAIMRPGRLDKTIYVGLPCPSDRLDILITLTKNGTKPKLMEDVSLEKVANDDRCYGFTGADLAALVREASVCALKSVISCTGDNKPSLILTSSHFDLAFTRVKPSVSERERFKYEKMKKEMSIGI